MKSSEKQRQSDKKYFKDVFYTLSIATEKEILKAEKIQNTLYAKYDKVIITPVGMCKVQIHATNK
jgi:hypothetical protein